MSEEVHGLPPSDPPPPRKNAASIPSDAIQHPLDRKAVAAMRNAVGFDDLVRAIFEYGIERAQRVVNLASAIKVSPQQFPDLYALHQRCAARLGVHPAPPLYITHGAVNAYTSGIDHPYIVLTSALINIATPSELEYVIGHELGHIRCEHMLYGTLARSLPVLSEVIPVVGRILGTSLAVLLMEWYRHAELSCDRFGLLCCQDLQSALRINIKMAGAPFTRYDQINIDAYLDQYEEFVALDKDQLSFIYKLLAQTNLTHPWMVIRAHELKDWHDHGNYQTLLGQLPDEARPSAPRDWQLPPRFCNRCHQALMAGQVFCGGCGGTETRLGHHCPACQTACPPHDRFCYACGTALKELG